MASKNQPVSNLRNFLSAPSHRWRSSDRDHHRVVLPASGNPGDVVLSPGSPLGDAPVPIDPGDDVFGAPGWLTPRDPIDELDPMVAAGGLPGNAEPPLRAVPATLGTPAVPGLALMPPVPPLEAPPVADDCANATPPGAANPAARTTTETIRCFMSISSENDAVSIAGPTPRSGR